MENSSREAIIISLVEDNTELRDLAFSLDFQISREFIQKRYHPDGKYFIGHGKFKMIHDYIKGNGISLALVNGRLKPSQWFNMEKGLGVTVYDRIHLILEIFADRAKRREALLQVQLAKYQYERPYVKELIHQAKMGEHPGYMGGGEYQVDEYYEMMKKRIRQVKYELQKICRDREARRRARRQGGFYLVSIAGYTNAGKSSLLNVLTDESLLVDTKLFSTLSTTTRRIKGYGRRTPPILLTDTVGFIRDLPHWLIQSFHATLEEIELADLVILCIDISENIEIIQMKVNASLNELHQIGTSASVVIALNKIDLLTKAALAKRISNLTKIGVLKDNNYITISSKEQINIKDLVNLIEIKLPSRIKSKIDLPGTLESQSFISWLHKKGVIVDIVYDTKVTICISCSELMTQKIGSQCRKLGGYISIL